MIKKNSIRYKLYLHSFLSSLLLFLVGLYCLYEIKRLNSFHIQKSVVLEDIRNVQLHFKIQVQEWKNILIRGHLEPNFHKYHKAFETEHFLIQEKINLLLKKQELSEEVKIKLIEFKEIHNNLFIKYNLALKEANINQIEWYKKVDEQVAGIDREPTKAFDFIAYLVESKLNLEIEKFTTQIQIILLSIFSFSIILLTYLSYKLSLTIIVPLEHSVKVLREVSKGNFSQKLNGKTHFIEFDSLLSSTEYLQKEMTNILKYLQEISNQSLNNSENLYEYSNKFDLVIKNLELTSKKNYENIQKGRQKVDKVFVAIQEIQNQIAQSREIVKNLFNYINETLHSQETLNKTNSLSLALISKGSALFNQLQKEVENIQNNQRGILSIVQKVQSLTKKTNMLALNASIEAARAGEFGKGFSIVAEEIGKLAEESNENLSDIHNINENSLNLLKNFLSFNNEVINLFLIINKNEKEVEKFSKQLDEKMQLTNEEVFELLRSLEDLETSEQILKNSIKEDEESTHTQEKLSSDLVSISKEVKKGSVEVDKIINSLQDNIKDINNILNKFIYNS